MESRKGFFVKSLRLKLMIVPLGLIVGAISVFYCLLSILKIRNLNTLGRDFSRTIYFVARLMGYPKVRVIGHTEWLEKDCSKVFVANHQSNWDMITFAKVFSTKTYVLGKKEILKVPLLGFFFQAAGSFLIDRSNKEAARECMNAMQERMKKLKHSAFIYPEGTRNKNLDVLLQDFKIGAFVSAQRAEAFVVPIVCLPYESKGLFGEITLKVLEPIDASKYTDAEELKNKAWSAIESELRAY